MTLDPGEILDNEYKIISYPQRGGMASVYRAVRLEDYKVVAIKIPHENFLKDTGSMIRFIHSEEIGLKLNHPRIIKYYPHPENPKIKYQVLEYIEGEPLSSYLLKHRRLTPRKAISFMFKILDGVSYLHSRNIVHLDLKPDNIFVTKEGDIKIIDFGISYDPEAKNQPWKDILKVQGTIGYFPPERLKGNISPLNDVFSCGVIFYEMLTGHLPWRKIDKKRVEYENPYPLSKFNPYISKNLEKIVMRAISPDPSKRFGSCIHFASELLKVSKKGLTKKKEPNYFLILIISLIVILLYIVFKIFILLEG